ncbi:cell wall-binding protein [Clostridium sp. HBUAS56010]|uniref:cell wall-binding protein n=1 Tax=Clostridium sp. HBUAS56010 TaxID=2571127 RepID=UPI0011787437|nr:cell wall-binding protein [Clostridium sp. HBUAS56010]
MFGKRILIVLLAVAFASVIPSMTAFAEAKKRVRTVAMKIETNIVPGGSVMHQPVEIDVDNDRYEVIDYLFTNQGLLWPDGDVPRLEITLKTVPGYCFKTSDYSFHIDGGTYVKQIKEEEVKDDDDEWKMTIRVVVDLAPVSEYTQEIKAADWTDGFVASWTSCINAGSYEVSIYRDGKRVGPVKRTENNWINLNQYMAKNGNYSFRVRPVNKENTGIRGQWVEVGSTYVDAEAANRNLIAAGIAVQ